MMRHEQRLLESHASSEEKLQTGKNLYDIIFMFVLEIKLNCELYFQLVPGILHP